MASGPQLSPEMVGSQLKITTDKEEEIIGELFSFHGGCVALVQSPSAGVDHGRFSFRIINSSTIKSFSVEKPSESSTLVAGIGDISGPLDMNRIYATEKKALANAQRAAAQINPEVTPQAQQLFNQLSKTFVFFFFFVFVLFFFSLFLFCFVFCFVFCVLCFVFCVLCFVFCVLCFVFCVGCFYFS